MADKNQELKKIPVLTVFKKGLIFKNIFLLDNNTSPPPSISLKDEYEEILLVGRHPDCNITLEHPSISRFHLEIHLKPSLQKLFVIDLASAHGTWVSDRRIESHVPVELSEGDTLKLAASSRSYRLHWYPLSRAFDVQNPYVPLNFQSLLPSVEEEEEKMFKEEDPSLMPESVDSSLCEQTRSAYSICDEEESRNLIVALDQSLASESFNSPSAPPMLEPKNFTLPEDECHNQIVVVHQSFAPETFDSPFKQNRTPSAPPMSGSTDFTFYIEARLPCSSCDEEAPFVLHDQTLAPESFNSSFKQNPCPSAPPMPQTMNFTLLEDECHNRNVVVEQSLAPTIVHSPLSHGEKVLSENVDKEVEKENHESAPILLTKSVAPAEGDPESTQCRSGKGSNKPSLWSRRGKPASLLRVQTALSNGENMELCRDIEALSEYQTEIEDDLSTKVFLSGSDGESHSFTPDKENFTPRKKEPRGELELEWSYGSFSPSRDDEKCMSLFSDKENLTPAKENLTPRTVLGSNSRKMGTRGQLELQRFYGSFCPSGDEEKGSSPLSDKENSTPAKENHTTRTVLGSISVEKGTFGSKSVLGSKSVEKGTRGEIGIQWSYGSLSSSRDQDKGMSPFSDRENRTPVILPVSRGKKSLSVSRLGQEAESNKKSGRLPLQSVETNSTSNVKSEVLLPLTNTTGSCSIMCEQGELIPKVLFTGADEEEEIFTPGKENYTPKTRNASNSVKKERRELELQKSYGALLVSQGMSPSSEKENITPKGGSHDAKLKNPLSGSRLRQEADVIESKRRAGRVPFQSLLINSMSDSPVPFTQARSSDTTNCDQTTNTSIPLSAKPSFGEANRKWYMVVDTNCLLNKETRRSLQLMKGLKGTQLIIPRTVVRELEALKRHGSLFGSVTEVSLVLQWIDECLTEVESWIHVQNSVEEHVPATPPASPSWSSWLSGESKRVFGRSMPLLPWSSLEAIVSPTAEDHILECALLYKTMKKDGRLVLLSDDIALKIKAMAEGVLCETAEEFRSSLIDPYSTRFLWAGSTPRGPTWSYLEEADLKENYRYVPVKNRLSGAADSAKKGLKLILRHKYSHYGQMTSVR